MYTCSGNITKKYFPADSAADKDAVHEDCSIERGEVLAGRQVVAFFGVNTGKSRLVDVIQEK